MMPAAQIATGLFRAVRLLTLTAAAVTITCGFAIAQTPSPPPPAATDPPLSQVVNQMTPAQRGAFLRWVDEQQRYYNLQVRALGLDSSSELMRTGVVHGPFSFTANNDFTRTMAEHGWTPTDALSTTPSRTGAWVESMSPGDRAAYFQAIDDYERASQSATQSLGMTSPEWLSAVEEFGYFSPEASAVLDRLIGERGVTGLPGYTPPVRRVIGGGNLYEQEQDFWRLLLERDRTDATRSGQHIRDELPDVASPPPQYFGPEGWMVATGATTDVFRPGWRSPWAEAALVEIDREFAQQVHGVLWTQAGLETYFDPLGVTNRVTRGARGVGSIWGPYDFDATRLATAGDRGGLDRLLAQPFNIILTWGGIVYDADLHVTGPLGASRFHIYYASPGSTTNSPFAGLVQDCICFNGSEVVLISQLQHGGVYRISVFDFGNQSPSSNELTTQGDLHIQIVRGGVVTPTPTGGTTLQGGRIIYDAVPAATAPGNTWVGVEVDPDTGRIFLVDHVETNTSPANVR